MILKSAQRQAPLSIRDDRPLRPDRVRTQDGAAANDRADLEYSQRRWCHAMAESRRKRKDLDLWASVSIS